MSADELSAPARPTAPASENRPVAGDRPAAPTAPSGSSPWLLRAVVLAQFAPAFLFSGIAVALPATGAELQLSATELGLVETVFLGSSAAFLLPAGRLCDVLDRGAVFRVTLVAFGLLAALAGLVTSAWALLLLRALQGVASALLATSGPAWLVDLVPVERRGRVFGAMIGAAYLGLATGPLVAGFVVAHLGWRAVFFVGGAWVLLGGLPALWCRTRRTQPRGGTLHLPSTVLLALGMAAVITAVSLADSAAQRWPWAAIAALAFGTFVLVQPRLASPLLDLRELLRNAALSRALIVQLLLYLNAFCSIFLLSLFLQVTKDLEARSAGLWLMIGSVVMACLAPSAGRLADRLRPDWLAVAGVTAVLASSACGTLLDVDSAPVAVGIVLALQGLGFGLFSSPNMAIIVGSLPRERSGFASALAAQSRSIGMFTGMAVTSALLAGRFEGRPVGDDGVGVSATVHSAYVVLLGTSVLALLVSASPLLRRRGG